MVGRAGAETGFRPPLPKRVRTEVWGVLDQALVSGVNFLTIVLLARVLPPSDFGYFVLAFTLLQLATTLQTATITRPHNVLGAAREGDAYRAYTRTAAAAQIGFAVGLALMLAIGAGAAYRLGASEASIVLAAVPALIFWQLQEFGRRVLYTEQRLRASLANDLVTYGLQGTALVLLWRLDALTPVAALSTLAVATGVGSLVAFTQVRRSLAGAFDRSCLRDNWTFGRWLTGAEVSYWFSSNAYLYLAAAILGPAASAVLKAAQTLMGPISVFLAFFINYLPVTFTRALHQAETDELRRVALPAWKVMASVASLYCLAIGMFASPVLAHVYGEQYAGQAATVRTFAVYYALLPTSLVLVSILTARMQSRRIFIALSAGALVSLSVAWPFLEVFGPAGAVVAMILSWAVSTSLLWRSHRDATRPIATTA